MRGLFIQLSDSLILRLLFEFTEKVLVNKKDIIQHITTLIKPQLILINQQQIVIRRRLQLGGLVLSSLAIFIYIKTSLSFSNAMMVVPIIPSENYLRK